jgi:hypothetical protein
MESFWDNFLVNERDSFNSITRQDILVSFFLEQYLNWQNKRKKFWRESDLKWFIFCISIGFCVFFCSGWTMVKRVNILFCLIVLYQTLWSRFWGDGELCLLIETLKWIFKLLGHAHFYGFSYFFHIFISIQFLHPNPSEFP